MVAAVQKRLKGWWQWGFKKSELSGSSGSSAKGLRRKVWTRKKMLSPNIRYFVAILRFVAIYALFWKSKVKKVPFWVKNSVSWARSALLHGIYCILHWVKFANLWWRICRENSKYALDESFHGHFCLQRKAANFCHPALRSFMVSLLVFLLTLGLVSSTPVPSSRIHPSPCHQPAWPCRPWHRQPQGEGQISLGESDTLSQIVQSIKEIRRAWLWERDQDCGMFYVLRENF